MVILLVLPFGLPAPALAPPLVGDLILYLGSSPCAIVAVTVEEAVGLILVVITLFMVEIF